MLHALFMIVFLSFKFLFSRLLCVIDLLEAGRTEREFTVFSTRLTFVSRLNFVTNDIFRSIHSRLAVLLFLGFELIKFSVCFCSLHYKISCTLNWSMLTRELISCLIIFVSIQIFCRFWFNMISLLVIICPLHTQSLIIFQLCRILLLFWFLIWLFLFFIIIWIATLDLFICVHKVIICWFLLLLSLRTLVSMLISWWIRDERTSWLTWL